MMSKPALNIQLAGPRGFCAGVERAISTVETALEKYGPPVYVRHEIVHNRFVVDNLRKKGAIFVDDLEGIPENARVIFSAHGVPKSIPEEANRKKLIHIDATCPLVSKVHVDTNRHKKAHKKVILIGHAGHPEVVGTLGQLSEGEILLIENAEQAENLAVPDKNNLAFVTQTTLSVDDTKEIIAILKRRFPNIVAPFKEDICYATTNRQTAVKAISSDCDAFIVVGAKNSSNSNRLVEVAKVSGCPKSILIARASELDLKWLENVKTLGVTAGASAPEILVQELIQKLGEVFEITLKELSQVREDVHFSLPNSLLN